ncbi:hypothetical protein BCR33DRAFT_849679 [Rhizoclosmatium globosum]|uniref:Secreted protein n=1 Tax=Rhizoclosmatium globosum TaxID=329046 RepID=A0A1Y2CGK7_9FUNG|nr:hypothetical protein BCR33DRAFT_849679 [Rhizoclosmatium globosum]|eukprot:ORY46056.1 hypothetical protein BCR33DRAFT_849679 [Rhizoclosmatium globosum]
MKLILLALLPSHSLACAVLWTPLRGIKYDSGTGFRPSHPLWRTVLVLYFHCYRMFRRHVPFLYQTMYHKRCIDKLDFGRRFRLHRLGTTRPSNFASGLMKTDNVFLLQRGYKLGTVVPTSLQVYNGFRKYNDYHSYVFPALWTPIPGIKYDNGGGGLYPPYKATLYALMYH